MNLLPIFRPLPILQRTLLFSSSIMSLFTFASLCIDLCALSSDISALLNTICSMFELIPVNTGVKPPGQQSQTLALCSSYRSEV